MKNKYRLDDILWPDNQTYRNVRVFIIQNLTHIYPEGEASAVTDELLFRLLGTGKDKRVLLNDTILTQDQSHVLKEAFAMLLQGVPEIGRAHV